MAVIVGLALLRRFAKEFKVLSDPFQFHPLAIEDCVTPSSLPKIEDYEDYLFIVTANAWMNVPRGFQIVHGRDGLQDEGRHRLGLGRELEGVQRRRVARDRVVILTEIVVTATKQSQDLQKTAAAITTMIATCIVPCTATTRTYVFIQRAIFSESGCTFCTSK